jgi:hypothetical protein
MHYTLDMVGCKRKPFEKCLVNANSLAHMLNTKWRTHLKRGRKEADCGALQAPD